MEAEDKLSNRQIVLLSAAISHSCWEIIARKYMKIGTEIIISLKDHQKDNTEGFSREIIRRWARKNPRPGQKTVRLLYI